MSKKKEEKPKFSRHAALVEARVRDPKFGDPSLKHPTRRSARARREITGPKGEAPLLFYFRPKGCY